MSKTPWTPAPWRYDGDGEARKIRGKDGASIALLMHLSLRARKSDAEVVANARLIAQSPRMAEVLERVLEDANRTKRGLTNRITPDTRIEVARLLAEIRADQ